MNRSILLLIIIWVTQGCSGVPDVEVKNENLEGCEFLGNVSAWEVCRTQEAIILDLKKRAMAIGGDTMACCVVDDGIMHLKENSKGCIGTHEVFASVYECKKKL